MSRSYAIRIPIEVLLSETMRNKLAGFKLNFPVLDILPPESMQALIKAKLLAAGFHETAEGLVMPAGKGETAVIDPATMEMTLGITIPGAQQVRVYEESMGWMKEQIKDALASGSTIVSETGTTLAEQLARQMTDLALQARAHVNAALKDVYREAIKEKAGQLGSVSNVSESSDGNVYRIRVEVSQ
ncbi:MAG: hypothetical protein PHD82_08255 [Candidatus Riflebacteria bacterium]|nr:hypothetical protein [Candidatus Riflebacteria bacterium]